MNRVIENEFLRAEIKEHGAELTSVKNKNGYEYLWQGDEKIWAKQCPVLFPVCGRLIDKKYRYGGKTYTLENHGFASSSDFSSSAEGKEKVSFTLTENEKTLARYPFRFRFTVSYALEGDVLAVEYRVDNTDDKDIYFSFGSHEAYKTEGDFGDWSLEFEKQEDLYVKVQPVLGFLNGEKKLFRKDVKELRMANELFDEDSLIFDGLSSQEVTLKRRGMPVVSVRFEPCESLLLWTKPGAPYLCIEPWYGLPDYARTDGDLTKKAGIVRLESGKSYSKTHKIRFYGV